MPPNSGAASKMPNIHIDYLKPNPCRGRHSRNWNQRVAEVLGPIVTSDAGLREEESEEREFRPLLIGQRGVNEGVFWRNWIGP
jgi:hypothetical protein